MEQTEVVGLTITTATLALAIFDRCLPPSHQVAEQLPTPAYIAQVQRTCLHAAPIAAALGIGASLLTRSPWPAVGTLAVVAWMWWQYDDAAKLGVLPATLTSTQPIGRYGR